MRLTTFLAIALASCMVWACGKATPESETRRWESAQKTLQTLGTKYSGFKPALEVVMTESTTLWEKALEETNEEKQLEAMSVANKAAYPLFVRSLDKIADEIETLKSLKTKVLQDGGTDEADKAALESVGKDVDEVLSDVKAMLKKQKVANPTEAEALLEEAKKAMINVSKRLKDVATTAKNKQSEAEATADSSSNADKAIKCAYCGGMNASGTLKCSGCGAPVEE